MALEPEWNVADALGAEPGEAIETLVIYVPSQDQDGNEFDPTPWIEEALRLLSDINGGATALPPADGAWVNRETERLVREKVTLVYSYIQPDRFESRVAEIREMLHRMGRVTIQGEVVFELKHMLFSIRAFDRP